MNDTNIFEQATKLKLRFAFRGSITTEDLWDLTPSELNSIYKDLSGRLRAEAEDSLLTSKTESARVGQLKLQVEIIKHIVTIKLAAIDAAGKAKARAEEIKKLKEILAQKQLAELGAKSTAEIQAALAALEAVE